jgi:hypothetical protein
MVYNVANLVVDLPGYMGILATARDPAASLVQAAIANG